MGAVGPVWVLGAASALQNFRWIEPHSLKCELLTAAGSVGGCFAMEESEKLWFRLKKSNTRRLSEELLEAERLEKEERERAEALALLRAQQEAEDNEDEAAAAKRHGIALPLLGKWRTVGPGPQELWDTRPFDNCFQRAGSTAERLSIDSIDVTSRTVSVSGEGGITFVGSWVRGGAQLEWSDGCVWEKELQIGSTFKLDDDRRVVVSSLSGDRRAITFRDEEHGTLTTKARGWFEEHTTVISLVPRSSSTKLLSRFAGLPGTGGQDLEGEGPDRQGGTKKVHCVAKGLRSGRCEVRVDAEPGDSVIEIKRQIALAEGLPWFKQRLSIDGQVLHNSATLGDFGVTFVDMPPHKVREPSPSISMRHDLRVRLSTNSRTWWHGGRSMARAGASFTPAWLANRLGYN